MRNSQVGIRPNGRVYGEAGTEKINYWRMHEGAGIALTDSFGQAASTDLVGTVTNLWSNRLQGITADAGGNASGKLTVADVPACDLTGVTAGKLVIAFHMQKSANPTGSPERIFVFGSTATSGNTGHALGQIQVAIETNGNVSLTFRPQTASDATAGTNVFSYVSNVGTSTSHHVAFVVDIDSASSGTIYGYQDGTQRDTDAINYTNGAGWPTTSAAFGAYIGTAGLSNGSASTANRMGQNGSGLKLGELLLWQTTDTLPKVLRVLDHHRRFRELPRGMF